ncbi:hypothetical protein NQF86_00790 [Bombella sp. TMW 2.2543]|uniref:C2H2-type domain-containing protein n=1 Tax=Bombella pluederhausensis TaxID=2967336 RepID=A0ABT3WDN8_9PROT|nr:hypothetical protein [Bombella pluederhausensis]MCX5617210.1 hypothetical protein [Bombella pluederhausensis]
MKSGPSSYFARLTRSAATRLGNTTQPLPARSLSACPCCHQPIQTTASQCAHCHAEKHYGPVRRESLICSLCGLALVLSLTRLLFPQLFAPFSLWVIPLMLAGLAAGFIFAQFRFAGDRWLHLNKG